MSYHPLIAQSNSKAILNGNIVDRISSEPLAGTVINFYSVNDSIKLGTVVANNKGYFSIEYSRQTPIYLVVSFIGYQNKTVLVNSKLEILTIQLDRVSVLLSQIEIKSDNRILFKKDTVQFDASGYVMEQNATLSPLLEKLPGFSISLEGAVYFNGELIQEILINGKRYFGKDVKVVLQNINSDLISKVEVIDKYPDESTITQDFRRKIKIVNLTIKSDKNNVLNGQAGTSYGLQNHHSSKIVLNKFQSHKQYAIIASQSDIDGYFDNRIGSNKGFNYWEAGISYAQDLNKRGKMSVSYRINKSKMESDQHSSHQSFVGDSSYKFEQSQKLNTNNFYQTLALNGDYKIDSTNNVLFNTSLSINNTKSDNILSYNTFLFGDKRVNSGNGHLKISSPAIYTDNDITVTKRSKKKDRSFTLNLAFITSTNNSDEYNESSASFLDSLNAENNINFNQYNKATNSSKRFRASVSYKEPIWKNGFISFYGGHVSEKYPSKKHSFDFNLVTEKYDTKNDSLSNEAINSTEGSYANISMTNFNDRFYSVLGIRLVNTTISSILTTNNVHLNFSRLFPLAYFRWNKSEETTIEVNYDTELFLPSYTQLNPIPDNSNPTYKRLGNLDLAPGYAHNIALSYNKSKNNPYQFRRIVFQASIYSNQIIDGTWILQGTQISQAVNVRGNYSFSMNAFNSNEWSSNKISLDLSTGISHSKRTYSTGSIIVHNKDYSFNNNAKFNFNKNKYVNFSVGGNANYNLILTPNISAIKYINCSVNLSSQISLPHQVLVNINANYNYINQENNSSYIMANTTISKTILAKKQLAVKLQCFNIFNQTNIAKRIIGSNYSENSSSTTLGRTLLLNIQYSFRSR